MPGHHLKHLDEPHTERRQPPADPDTAGLPDHSVTEFAERWERTENRIRLACAAIGGVSLVGAVVILVEFGRGGYVYESGAARVAAPLVLLALLSLRRALHAQRFQGEHLEELPWWQRLHVRRSRSAGQSPAGAAETFWDRHADLIEDVVRPVCLVSGIVLAIVSLLVSPSQFDEPNPGRLAQELTSLAAAFVATLLLWLGLRAW